MIDKKTKKHIALLFPKSEVSFRFEDKFLVIKIKTLENADTCKERIKQVFSETEDLFTTCNKGVFCARIRYKNV